MPDYKIRTMDVSELRFFYKHITQDFSAGEYAPHEILFRQLGEGLQDGLVFCTGKQDLAYAFCAARTDWVLLSLFAVLPEFRGQGLGSLFLQSLLQMYSGKRAILGEVERPELASDSTEMKLRSWRIEFYKKAGFYLIPDTNYIIWDVPMHLMALPLTVCREIIDASIQAIMHEIYLQLMGKQFMHKMRFE